MLTGNGDDEGSLYSILLGTPPDAHTLFTAARPRRSIEFSSEFSLFVVPFFSWNFDFFFMKYLFKIVFVVMLQENVGIKKKEFDWAVQYKNDSSTECKT